MVLSDFTLFLSKVRLPNEASYPILYKSMTPWIPVSSQILSKVIFPKIMNISLKVTVYLNFINLNGIISFSDFHHLFTVVIPRYISLFNSIAIFMRFCDPLNEDTHPLYTYAITSDDVSHMFQNYGGPNKIFEHIAFYVLWFLVAIKIIKIYLIVPK